MYSKLMEPLKGIKHWKKEIFFFCEKIRRTIKLKESHYLMLNLLINNQEQHNPFIKDVYTW